MLGCVDQLFIRQGRHTESCGSVQAGMLLEVTIAIDLIKSNVAASHRDKSSYTRG